jgi:hypothetical protein
MAPLLLRCMSPFVAQNGPLPRRSECVRYWGHCQRHTVCRGGPGYPTRAYSPQSLRIL